MVTSIAVLDKDSVARTVATNDAVIDELQLILAKLTADPATQTTLAAILAKLIAAPATESAQTTGNATLASILAKIIAAPATEAAQTTGNASLSSIVGHVDGIEGSLASILAKIIAAPATEASQTTIIGHVDGIEASLTSILAKIIAAPATEAKQDTMITGINRFSQAVEGESVAASQTTQVLGSTGASGDYLSHITIIPATVSPGSVQVKDGALTAFTVFTGGTDSLGALVPFTIPIGEVSVNGAWQVTTGANVSVRAAGNFT